MTFGKEIVYQDAYSVGTNNNRYYAEDINEFIMAMQGNYVVSGCGVTVGAETNLGVSGNHLAVASGTAFVNGAVRTIGATNIDLSTAFGALNAGEARLILVYITNAGAIATKSGDIVTDGNQLPEVSSTGWTGDDTTPLAWVYLVASDSTLDANQIFDQIVYAPSGGYINGLLTMGGNIDLNGNNQKLGTTSFYNWSSGFQVIQGNRGALTLDSSSENTQLWSNLYYDGTNFRAMIGGVNMGRFGINEGDIFASYASGSGVSADDIVSLTELFFLDASAGTFKFTNLDLDLNGNAFASNVLIGSNGIGNNASVLTFATGSGADATFTGGVIISNPGGGSDPKLVSNYGSQSLGLDGNLIPVGTHNLGASSLRWDTIYLVNSPDVSSALQYKNIEGKIENPLNLIQQMNGYYYHRKDDPDKNTRIGLIADEIYKFLPELVTIDEGEISGLKYMEVIPILVESIKELYEIVSK